MALSATDWLSAEAIVKEDCDFGIGTEDPGHIYSSQNGLPPGQHNESIKIFLTGLLHNLLGQFDARLFVEPDRFKVVPQELLVKASRADQPSSRAHPTARPTFLENAQLHTCPAARSGRNLWPKSI